MIMQLLSIVGACCLLFGYYLGSSQMDNRQRQFVAIIFNIVGSAILTYTAFDARQYGFIILEGIWCIISIKNLIRYNSVTE